MSFPALLDPSFPQFCICLVEMLFWNIGKCFQALEVSQEF